MFIPIVQYVLYKNQATSVFLDIICWTLSNPVIIGAVPRLGGQPERAHRTLPHSWHRKLPFQFPHFHDIFSWIYVIKIKNKTKYFSVNTYFKRGNSEHVAYVCRKIGLFQEKNPIFVCSRSKQMP